MIHLPKILPAPKRPDHLPETASWLSGEGAGSWFVIKEIGEWHYHVIRYSPEGVTECANTYISSIKINTHSELKVTYPSNCSVVTILQGRKKIILRGV